ncbi:5844_t:CDS:2 [Acaulospora morrowiae]|uniref:5844_t:CDS:1 n=1 Tax=Acaulospora morrowiae TaxID=94023 RepID=A0A9N9BJA2_9GLOM|nr:5844_t:CDS:2 [Acaulospora morrowiae]
MLTELSLSHASPLGSNPTGGGIADNRHPTLQGEFWEFFLVTFIRSSTFLGGNVENVFVNNGTEKLPKPRDTSYGRSSNTNNMYVLCEG